MYYGISTMHKKHKYNLWHMQLEWIRAYDAKWYIQSNLFTRSPIIYNESITYALLTTLNPT